MGNPFAISGFHLLVARPFLDASFLLLAGIDLHCAVHAGQHSFLEFISRSCRPIARGCCARFGPSPGTFRTLAFAHVDRLGSPARTAEYNDLNAISTAQDAQKKIAMYQDFLQKYASNPLAVAYANWQLAESYQTAGDLQKAIACGEKAAAASPHNLDILTSVVTVDQPGKDNARMFKYSVQGGDAYDVIDK